MSVIRWALLVLMCPVVLVGQEIPRVVIAIYNRETEKNTDYTKLHQVGEMPCNHLGLIFEYYAVQEPLPDLSERSDVVGVYCWLLGKPKLSYEQSISFFDWSLKALDLGKRYLVMGDVYFSDETLQISKRRVNEFWKKLGLQGAGSWIDDTYRVKLKRTDSEMTGFERQYPDVLPGFMQFFPTSKNIECLLKAEENETGSTLSCLIAVSDAGGYVADGYGIYYLYEKGRISRKWYLNPFLFFSKVFGVGSEPKLDTTTLVGRRIYYSLIDGDGWNSSTQLKGFPSGMMCSTVLYDDILKKNPDLPVTVAPIGADVDLSWVAKSDSQAIARKIFSLPQVEMGSHTFTHPFDWSFFKNYTEEKEMPYLHLYPNGSWKGEGLISRVTDYFYGSGNTLGQERAKDPETGEPLFDEDYIVPRAFALQPFDLTLEVSGSVNLINTLSDEKQVKLYQWSGNCEPFCEALKAVNEMNILNMNGGDSRFDNVYSSYAWVAPLGREVCGVRQVYSSNANENIYTELWSTNFFGFNLLPQTFKRTESPIRIHPMCLYYHVYSTEKNASLNALEQNIAYIRSQEFIPIHASHFADLVMGFYEAKIEKKGERVWGISGRRSLQTVRFDQAALLGVDERRSEGVIGYRYFQGSLYIFLDPASDEVVVAVSDGGRTSSRYSLIQSKWEISHVRRNGDELEFQAKGFGPGEMAWRVIEEGNYEISTDDGFYLLVPSKNRQVIFTIPESDRDVQTVQIKKRDVNSITPEAA